MWNLKHNFKRLIALQSIQSIIAWFHVKRCSSWFWSDRKEVPEFLFILLFFFQLFLWYIYSWWNKRRFAQKSFFKVEDPNACSFNLTSWFLVCEVVPLASISRFNWGWTLERVCPCLPSVSSGLCLEIAQDFPSNTSMPLLFCEVFAVAFLPWIQSCYLLHPGFHVIRTYVCPFSPPQLTSCGQLRFPVRCGSRRVRKAVAWGINVEGVYLAKENCIYRKSSPGECSSTELEEKPCQVPSVRGSNSPGTHLRLVVGQ